MSERKPLTLEELRKMDGKPAYWLDDDSYGIISVDSSGRWANVPFFRGRKNGVNFEYNIESRRIEVYATELPRLDRSAWEPCEFCRERDREVYKTEDYPGICDFEVMLDGPYEITVNAYNHYTPFTEEICFSFPVLFCPKCSRPLTDEAWEMLEKRLEV